MPRTTAHGTQMLAQWTLKLLRDAGLSQQAQGELLAELGTSLAALTATGATIEHDVACTIWERLAPPRPSDFGVRFSEQFDLRGLGLLGYLAAASASLGDMLARVVRFHDLVKRPPTATLARRATDMSIVETLPPYVRPWPRPLAESILGAYMSFSRKLTGAAIAAVHVRFQHAAPPRPLEVERFFGGPVEYQSHVNELVLPGDAWDLPIATGDPTLLEYLETLAGQRTQRSEIERLRAHVAQALSAGRAPALSGAARVVGWSARTLQRRLLDEHQLTFRALVDDVRRESAERLLSDRRLNLEEVSYLLGFNDPSALRKARRRWRQGVTRSDRSLA
jgi:AraC-like DNA-binding protein